MELKQSRVDKPLFAFERTSILLQSASEIFPCFFRRTSIDFCARKIQRQLGGCRRTRTGGHGDRGFEATPSHSLRCQGSRNFRWNNEPLSISCSLISETQLAHVIEISRSQIPYVQMLAGESTHVAVSSSSSSSWSGRSNVQLVGLQHKRNSVKNACKPRQWQVSCQSATSTGTVVAYPRAFVNSKFTEAKCRGIKIKEGACHMSHVFC